MTRRVGKGFVAFLCLVLVLAQAGCFRGAPGGIPPPPPPSEAPASGNAAPAADGPASPDGEEEGDASGVSGPSAVPDWIPPAVPLVEPGNDDVAAAPPEPARAREPEKSTGAADIAAAGLPAAVPPAVDAARGPERESAAPPPDVADRPASPPPAETAAAIPGHRNGAASGRKPKPADAPHPAAATAPKGTQGASPPGWSNGPEELVYRVDFIGITMGYARFRYVGKVSIAGKVAYHLNVRAWTSGVLAYIYPINDTIDYYLDAETIAPIRQEFLQGRQGRDDVAVYDQESGTIVYRYRKTGKIRKRVDAVPSVYDPVSVAYYFRWRDLGAEDRPRNVYAGRKVWQISARVLGKERIRTEHGEVDTIAVRPLIRRGGKIEDKGDLKIWFSGDERRVPVRLYAKFRKIKEWTLVGELMPPKAGG